MYVVATAGHVDHGKSALVRALTGMEPDRWAEERRRGMTIDLGFAWTTLPSGADLAFVDVPGHERFVPNMLAGVGPVPAAMVVVAADEGWMPQSEEHLQVLDALGVRHGLLVVTKADLADSGPATGAALDRIRGSSLGRVEHVAVSAVTGAGLDDLRAGLDRLVARLPPPDVEAPVRLWVDRAFTIRGAGTVVTGTLAAGTIRVGDSLALVPLGREVAVRGLESRKRRTAEVTAVARVAVNLRGVDRGDVARGAALVTPGSWVVTDEVDAVVSTPMSDRAGLVAHIGSAAVAVRVRPLPPGAARLRLAAPLPLHLGDRMLLRDPGRHVVVAAADVADLQPTPLTRRGAAAAVGAALAVPMTVDALLRRRGVLSRAEARASGVPGAPTAAVEVGDWWIDAQQWEQWRRRVRTLVEQPDPLGPGLTATSIRTALGLPATELAAALVAAEPRPVHDAGGVRWAGAEVSSPGLERLTKRLAGEPLAAPEAGELAALGLDRVVLGHAVRTGLLLHLGHGVYVGPTAVEVAVERLRGLPQPFTVSAARQALGSTRRVVLPLLEHLDAARRTRRQPDGSRVLVARER